MYALSLGNYKEESKLIPKQTEEIKITAEINTTESRKSIEKTQ